MALLFRTLLAIVGLGFLIWRYAPWPTRTLVFKDQNFQCEVPYNWVLKDNPKFKLEAQRSRGGSFFVEAKPTFAAFRIDNPVFSQTIKNNLVANGHEILGESREPFEGYAAYSYTMHAIINGKSIYTHSVNFVAGQFRYDLLIAEKDFDPEKDPQLEAALHSFRLIEKPDDN